MCYVWVVCLIQKLLVLILYFRAYFLIPRFISLTIKRNLDIFRKSFIQITHPYLHYSHVPIRVHLPSMLFLVPMQPKRKFFSWLDSRFLNQPSMEFMQLFSVTDRLDMQFLLFLWQVWILHRDYFLVGILSNLDSCYGGPFLNHDFYHLDRCSYSFFFLLTRIRKNMDNVRTHFGTFGGSQYRTQNESNWRIFVWYASRIATKSTRFYFSSNRGTGTEFGEKSGVCL